MPCALPVPSTHQIRQKRRTPQRVQRRVEQLVEDIELSPCVDELEHGGQGVEEGHVLASLLPRQPKSVPDVHGRTAFEGGQAAFERVVLVFYGIPETVDVLDSGGEVVACREDTLHRIWRAKILKNLEWACLHRRHRSWRANIFWIEFDENRYFCIFASLWLHRRRRIWRAKFLKNWSGRVCTENIEVDEQSFLTSNLIKTDSSAFLRLGDCTEGVEVDAQNFLASNLMKIDNSAFLRGGDCTEDIEFDAQDKNHEFEFTVSRFCAFLRSCVCKDYCTQMHQISRATSENLKFCIFA